MGHILCLLTVLVFLCLYKLDETAPSKSKKKKRVLYRGNLCVDWVCQVVWGGTLEPGEGIWVLTGMSSERQPSVHEQQQAQGVVTQCT